MAFKPTWSISIFLRTNPNPWRDSRGYLADPFTLPPVILDKRYKGEVLDESGQEMAKRTPSFAEKCLSHIPRINALCEILRRHTHNFAAGKKRPDADLDEGIPWEARALKIARDCDLLDAGERMRNFSPELADRELVRTILQSSAGPATQPVLAGSRA